MFLKSRTCIFGISNCISALISLDLPPANLRKIALNCSPMHSNLHILDFRNTLCSIISYLCQNSSIFISQSPWRKKIAPPWRKMARNLPSAWRKFPENVGNPSPMVPKRTARSRSGGFECCRDRKRGSLPSWWDGMTASPVKRRIPSPRPCLCQFIWFLPGASYR